MGKRCAGIKIPVFSLRSKKGLGSGEFLDLIPLIDWCKESGLKMIQLAPIHDKEASLCSLDPIYLNIHELAPELDDEIKPVQKVLNQPHLEYRRTYLAKRELLKMLFIMRGQEDVGSKAFERFFKRFGFTERGNEELEFFYFVQFHLDRQLHQVVKYAEEQGILLMGDFPMGTHSTLPWMNHYFDAIHVGHCSQDELAYIQDHTSMLITADKCTLKESKILPLAAFEDPKNFPEKSFCTTTLNGMIPLRAWWEKNEEKAALCYHTILKQVGKPPQILSASIAQQIVQAYLNSKSKFAIFPLQDLLAISEALRSPDAANEIKHWRCHIYIEEFLLAKSFAKQIREMVKEARR
jgi:4-alpha-glucanotransferase